MMTIKEHARAIETLSKKKIDDLIALGKDTEKLSKRINKLIEERADIETEMANIIEELAPIEYLLRTQHPSLVELIDTLKGGDTAIDTERI